MTVESIFLRAIGVEHKLALIYAQIEKLFPQVPGLAEFWKDLARDEEHHARMLREVLQSLPPEQLQAPCQNTLAEETAKIEKLVEQRSLRDIATLDDAYELAHELEHSEINTVFKTLAGDFVRSDLRADFISAEVIGHQQKLTKFKRQFGDKPWRKSINANAVADSK